MQPEQAADLIWSEAGEGRWFPPALQGQLTLEEALRAQLLVRDRKAASGPQGGWKIGLTSERVRARYGIDARPFGHIMARDIYESGADIPLANFPHAAIEPELCFTMGETLTGPGITPERVRKAVSAASPGFELNQGRAQGVKDFPLTVADNLSQWGIVTAAGLSPLPADFDFTAMQVTLRRGDEEIARAVGADVIDDHFLSLSILANTLADYGEPLAAGMRVITGSYAKVDVSPGEHWQADFAGIGSISISFS